MIPRPTELQARDQANRQQLAVAAPGGSSEEIQACWNEIGVYGDRSCAQLLETVHCRNCPVYSHAGVQLLNRSLAPEYRIERTAHYSREKKAAASGRISALLFRVGPEWLSLPTQLFQEVAPNRLVHSLPHRRRGFVLGLVNVRGELTICVSLARLLGIEDRSDLPTGRDGHSRLLVASWEDSRFAFPVSEVHGIHRFDPQMLKEPPATLAQSALAFSRGVFLWQEKTVGAIDPDKLFSAVNRNLS